MFGIVKRPFSLPPAPSLRPFIEARDALKECRPDVYEQVKDLPMAVGMRRACRLLGIHPSPVGAPLSDLYRIAKAVRCCHAAD